MAQAPTVPKSLESSTTTSGPNSRKSSTTISTPPSCAVSVHDHILPKGWACRKDERTNKYYFVHEDGQPSPDTCGGRHMGIRYRQSEFALERITKIFPEVDEGHVSYLMRIYHNDEEMVVKTLLGEGCRVEGMTVVDEGLFYKIRTNFPRVNPEYIRMLLSKHRNQEHETIAAILYAQSSRGCPYDPEPKIKLRYLKVLYPDVDEDQIYDLLVNNGHNARIVMDTLDQLGFKKNEQINIPVLRRDKFAKDEKPQRPTSMRLQFPSARSDKDKILKSLKEEFPDVSSLLVELALECSFYDREKAAIFLRAMTPQDSDKYMPKPKDIVDPPEVRCVVGTQTGDYFVDVIWDVPLLIKKADKNLFKSDCEKSTWTEEDGVIIREPPPKLAKGPDKSYVSQKSTERVERLVPIGPKESNRRGPLVERISSMSLGSRVQRLVTKGPDPSLRKGPDPNNRIKKIVATPFDHVNPFSII